MVRCLITTALVTFFLSVSVIYAKPDQIIIPYQTVGRTMIIEGKMNGRIGHLIFDTGIPKILLNQKYADQSALFTNKEFQGLQSVNGAQQNRGMSLVQLEINEFNKKVAADVVDLSQVEFHKGIDILGFVGIDLFRKYELEIDGFSRTIRLYRIDKSGNRITNNMIPPSISVPFRNHGHLSCIPVRFNGKTIQLGLDTGAEINIINETIYVNNRDQFEKIKTVKMIDLNGKPIAALSAIMKGLKIKNMIVPFSATLCIPNNTQYGGLDSKKVHGLLGFEFFQQHKTVINFKKKLVSFWNEENIRKS
jgi:predicted aspartyl protease